MLGRKKLFGPKEIFGLTKLRAQKIFGFSQKILGPKSFWVPKKIWGLKKTFGKHIGTNIIWTNVTMTVRVYSRC